MIDFEKTDLPLSLVECTYSTFDVDWKDDDGNERNPFPKEVDVDASIEHISTDGQCDWWRVDMSVCSLTDDLMPFLDDDEPEPCDVDDESLLFFNVVVSGIFVSIVPDKEGIPVIHGLVASDAAQTLLGIVRERIAQATHDSEYGTYYLPGIKLFIEPQEIKPLKHTGKRSSKKGDKKQTHLKLVKG